MDHNKIYSFPNKLFGDNLYIKVILLQEICNSGLDRSSIGIHHIKKVVSNLWILAGFRHLRALLPLAAAARSSQTSVVN